MAAIFGICVRKNLDIDSKKHTIGYLEFFNVHQQVSMSITGFINRISNSSNALVKSILDSNIYVHSSMFKYWSDTAMTAFR